MTQKATKKMAKKKTNKRYLKRKVPMVETTNLRAIAAQVVHQVSHEQKSLSSLMPPALEKVPSQDKALLQELCFGTCRWYHKLQAIQQCLMVQPLPHLDIVVNSAILVGIYQLLEMRTPAHAAIYETVEAVEALGFFRLKGMVNGILRNVEREEEWPEELIDADTYESFFYEYSHPRWFIDKLSNNWPDRWQEILHINNERPPMTLRVNLNKVSRDEYLEKLNAADIDARATKYAPTGITLNAPVDVTALPDFEEGFVSVQDEAAQLCCELLDVPAKARILDTCAAPGGKTCAILERFPDAEVTAIDIDPKRVERIHQNLERTQLKANVVTGDAADPDSWWDKQLFDRILLDAPCSATGVIRRHPDIKLLRQENDIVPLASLQLSLLESSWAMLKPGGKLVYATCSVFSQENGRIIERFVNKQSDATLIPIEAEWGTSTSFGQQLFPQEGGHDGFFYACLKKSG